MGEYMNLLIAASTCSEKKIDEILNYRKKKAIDPQQKFFRLFIEGINKVENVTTTVVSALPVSASTVSKKNFKYEEENIDTINYHYLPFRNGKFMRYFTTIISTIKEIKKWCHKYNAHNSIVIVDPLVPQLSIPTRIIAQKKGFKVGAIVTDIPSLTTIMKERNDSYFKRNLLKLYQKISDNDLFQFDFYIPLTESLNAFANVKEKPYCIVEGFADSLDTKISKVHDNYIMYAGGVYERFGVKNLVDAFIKINNPNIELWIFGEGTYVSKIQEINKIYSNIKYKGCVSPEEVVKIEKKAKLLVNPRPTKEKYAKYSFPSKTMEYLLSGTPVCSTKLPGIPIEYYDYLYMFYDDNVNAIAQGLTSMLSCTDEQLNLIGKKGHDFVLKEKNNIVMAKKIISMCKSIM